MTGEVKLSGTIGGKEEYDQNISKLKLVLNIEKTISKLKNQKEKEYNIKRDTKDIHRITRISYKHLFFHQIVKSK